MEACTWCTSCPGYGEKCGRVRGKVARKTSPIGLRSEGWNLGTLDGNALQAMGIAGAKEDLAWEGQMGETQQGEGRAGGVWSGGDSGVPTDHQGTKGRCEGLCLTQRTTGQGWGAS